MPVDSHQQIGGGPAPVSRQKAPLRRAPLRGLPYPRGVPILAACVRFAERICTPSRLDSSRRGLLPVVFPEVWLFGWSIRRTLATSARSVAAQLTVSRSLSGGNGIEDDCMGAIAGGASVSATPPSLDELRAAAETPPRVIPLSRGGRHDELVGQSAADAVDFGTGTPDCSDFGTGVDHRRQWHRQRGLGAADSASESAVRPALCARQLCGPVGDLDRKRTVWARAWCIHGCRAATGGAFRMGRQRHAAVGRDQRDPPEVASQTATRVGGRGVSAGGE